MKGGKELYSSTVPEAQVSLRHMRGLLQAIDELGATDAARVRTALARHQLEAIVRNEGDWHPAALMAKWTETLDATLGRRSLQTVFRNFAKLETKSSIVKSFVAGAVRMFGPGGATLARRIPSGMSLMYRDLGTIYARRVSSSEHDIVLDDLAAPCSESPSYAHAVAAYYQGLFDALGVKGTASVAEHDRAARRVVIRCVWT